MFKSKQRIQLPADDQQPSLIKRSSSSWSLVPCCAIRGQRIQLPDEDSDSETEHQVQAPSDFSSMPAAPAPFNIEFDAATTNGGFLQRTNHLSRNPFARAEDTLNRTINIVEVVTKQHEEEEIVATAVQKGTEELADFSSASKSDKYANEPDWTEMYQEEEEEETVSKAVEDIVQNINHTEEAVIVAEDTMDVETINESEVEELTVGEAPEEEDTITINTTSEKTTKEENTQKEKELKIPQIEEDILKLLPLPQLSNEIPPTMIHQEKSMYGDEPLIYKEQRTSRISNSRFSMSEQDFLAFKKKQQQKQQDAVTETKKTLPESSTTEESAATKNEENEEMTIEDKRSSMAHSILGDKLDDFTEKLAFIKKNIIMSIESDEEDIEEADNAQETLKKIVLLQQQTSNTSSINKSVKDDEEEGPRRPLHRRTSSLMDVAPTIARFFGSNNEPTASTSTSTQASNNFSPSSLFSSLAGPDPSTTKREVKEEEEEIFDFTKVIEVGKNLKTFSEGFVGNGIRMFNDVATRMKTSVEPDDKEEEEGQIIENNWLNDSYI